MNESISPASPSPTILNAAELSSAFVGIFVLHAVLVRMSPLVAGAWLVFGSASLTPLMAQFAVALLSALLVVSTFPLVETMITQFDIEIPVWQWVTGYAVYDAMIIWGMSRFAEAVGMGITSFWVAVLAGVVLAPLQAIVVETSLRFYRQATQTSTA